MKKTIRLIAIFIALAVVMLVAGCSSTGSGYASSSIGYGGVYGGYGYPYYGYGYGGCCNGRPVRPVRPIQPDHPNRPVRPEKPGGPSIQPVPKQRRSSGMGRPSRSQMSRPARMPRMGGGRRR